MVLSYQGSYMMTQSGKIRYELTGLSLFDIAEWRPKGCWFQAGFINAHGEKSYRGNILGYFFAPLIMIDRKFIHKTQNPLSQQPVSPNPPPSGPVD